MSDYAPKFLPGISVPVTLSASVTGGQLITTTGAVAGDAAANVAGVAAYDGASGSTITCIRAGIHRLTAGASITNGQPVCAAASGGVRLWVAGTDPVAAYLGTAWSTAANGASVDVALYAV
ncbi:capsid cement protein [uncultured Jatrophihabitans sp.]|uniref:capsid cement protein n=1 Tax=uncultured Jatrophihabitans sp. TaxID=1610747 RepID=UPI0035C9C572